LLLKNFQPQKSTSIVTPKQLYLKKKASLQQNSLSVGRKESMQQEPAKQREVRPSDVGRQDSSEMRAARSNSHGQRSNGQVNESTSKSQIQIDDI